jgi:hypothetical protein
MRVECGGHNYEEAATLVLHKGGLERLDRVDDAAPSNASLAEIGIEPS